MGSMGPKDDLCHDVSGETAHSDCVYGLAKAAYGFFLQSGNSNPLEELCGRYKGEAAIMCIYGSMSMQARSIEGAAAPEERASPQRIRQKETWCRQQFAVLPSDEFDHNNFNHMKVGDPKPSPGPSQPFPILTLARDLGPAHNPTPAPNRTLVADRTDQSTTFTATYHL